jgi:CHAT domain-containing protein
VKKKQVDELAQKYNLSLNIINAGAYKERDVKEMLLRNMSKMLLISTHGSSFTDKETDKQVQGISTKELTDKQENRKENDGYLSTDELNKLGVLNDLYLLFLNACATASKDINNQSTITRLFENNQIENIIGSYWNIDDEFTYQFAMAFIENLAKDKNIDVAKALRTTQLQALREAKEAEKLFNSYPEVIKAQKNKNEADKAFQETEFISLEQWAPISHNKEQTKKELEMIEEKITNEIAKKGRFYRAGYQRPYFWAAYQYLSKQYAKKDYTLQQTIQEIDLEGVNNEQLQILQSKLKENEAVVDIRILSKPDDKIQLYQAIVITKKTYQKIDIEDKDEATVLGDYTKSNKYNTSYNESYERTWSKIDVILQKSKISKIYITAQGNYKDLSFNALFDYQNQKFLIQKYEIQSLF